MDDSCQMMDDEFSFTSLSFEGVKGEVYTPLHADRGAG